MRRTGAAYDIVPCILQNALSANRAAPKSASKTLGSGPTLESSMFSGLRSVLFMEMDYCLILWLREKIRNSHLGVIYVSRRACTK